MPSHATESQVARALEEAVRQTKRAQRAETVRQRQRALLLDLIACTMCDLRIPFSELRAARRNLAQEGAGQPAQPRSTTKDSGQGQS